jgi:glycogen debranching enzyme
MHAEYPHGVFSRTHASCEISVRPEADFADLFEVKEAHIQRRWEQTREVDGDSLAIRGAWQDVRKGILVQAPGADVTQDTLTYRVSVGARSQWSTILTVVPSHEAASPPPPSFIHAEDEEISPRDRRRQKWVAKIPKLHMDNQSIERTLRRGYDDLGALRIEDPNHPERIVVAAGAPWFMTLFGRDSLWASDMALCRRAVPAIGPKPPGPVADLSAATGSTAAHAGGKVGLMRRRRGSRRVPGMVRKTTTALPWRLAASPQPLIRDAG